MSRQPARWMFERLARPYELLVFQRTWREHARRLLDQLPPRRGRPRVVLDVGCGPGVSALAMLAAAPGDRFVGVDFSRPMLARAAARRRAEGVAPERLPFACADASRLPFAPATFDGVTGHSFLYLVPDQAGVLAEIRRVLAPGGRLALLEPAAGPQLAPVLRSLRHGPRFAASMAAWRVVSRGFGQFTAGRLRETLAAAGFASVRVEPTLDGLGLLAVAESVSRGRAEGPAPRPGETLDLVPPSPEEIVARARETARVLYEGKQVAHRSCGIALAETFGVPSRPYQALRRGGLTGEGQCGAIKAGELILGELFGDPDPAGPVTTKLRDAVAHYQAETARRVDRGGSPTIVCNDLTRRFPIFQSEARQGFCTGLAATVAEVLAETILEYGAPLEIRPLPER